MNIIDLIMMLGIIILIGISQVLTYRREKQTKEEKNSISTIDTFCEKHYKKIWIIFAIILFISVIYKYGELPTYIAVDEAAGIYDAINIANYGVERHLESYPVYLSNFGGGQSVLSCYLTVILIKLFGSNMITFRLPFLILYIVAVVTAYLMVSKAKNKKWGLLFTFLIITCPWLITSARKALDCNLYAGMLMLNLFLMNRAKKNYQYVIAGISVGITLYTYCLSWITMPIFLATWAIYMLYIKKIKIRQLIIFGIPIAILAAPLIYFLLLNYGIFNQTQFGPITISKMPVFRNGEVSIANIGRYGLFNLTTIFTADNTIYPMCIPLFLVGYVVAIKETFKNIKKKEYSVTALITIAFTTILLGLLLARIPTANKANALYIPILYFVTIGILKLFEHSKTIFIICLTLFMISFINFEYRYYTYDARNIADEAVYDDNSFHKVIEKLENNKETQKMQKHVLIMKAEPDIYQLFTTRMSPYKYNEIAEKEYKGNIVSTRKIGNYHYYVRQEHFEEFYKEACMSSDNIIIVSRILLESIEEHTKNIENYEKIEYKDLCIFIEKSKAPMLQKILE